MHTLQITYCIPRAYHMIPIPVFPVRTAFLPHLSSILLLYLVCHLAYFVIHIPCLFWELSHRASTSKSLTSLGWKQMTSPPNDWMVVWNMFIFPYIGNNQLTNIFRGVEITNQITLSHSSSVLKLTLVDGPSWHNNFGDGALNYYKGFFFPNQKRFSRYNSVLTRTPVLDSFGCFSCPNHTQMVRKVAIRGLTTHPDHIHFVSNWSAIASPSPATGLLTFVGFLSSWLFLLILSKNIFGVPGHRKKMFAACLNLVTHGQCW